MRMVLVITGANRGLGKALAQKAVRSNFLVVLACRNEEEGRELSRNLGCHFVFLDVTDLQSIQNAVREIQEKFGKIHCLINNAGIRDNPTRPWKDDAREIMKTNFWGVVHCTQCFHEILSGGIVINVASLMGIELAKRNRKCQQFLSHDQTEQGIQDLVEDFLRSVEDAREPRFIKNWPGYKPYAISKLAVIAQSKLWAESHPDLIFISCTPGRVATAMNRGSGKPIEDGAEVIFQLVTSGKESTGAFYSDKGLVPFEFQRA